MNSVLLDSSVWIEYLNSGNSKIHLTKYLKEENQIFTFPLIHFEVSRFFRGKISVYELSIVKAHLEQYPVLSCDSKLAYLASDLSKKFKLGMSDSFIYAAALESGSTLITLDNDFRGLDGVLVLA